MARCEDAPCCGCCPSSQEAYYDYREEIDLDPWADVMDWWGEDARAAGGEVGEEEYEPDWDGMAEDQREQDYYCNPPW